MRVAIRDAIRATVLGPLIRDVIIAPYRRTRLSAQAKQMALTDNAVFVCPICSYNGIFVDFNKKLKTTRRYEYCPKCGSLGRHRLQWRVLDIVLPTITGGNTSALHFAPEKYFVARLRGAFESYKTSDLFRRDVDIHADLCNLPMSNNSFDFIYASHVLEHIPDDRQAMREIYRVLKPGGVAILPVPMNNKKETIEYDRAVPEEDGHVRSPGIDYFDRYRAIFDSVDVFSSDYFSGEASDNQLTTWIMSEDTPPVDRRLLDYVPVCRKRAA